MRTRSASTFPVVYKMIADATMGTVALTTASLVGLLLAVNATGNIHSAAVATIGHRLLVQIPVLVALMLAVYAAWGAYGRRVRGLRMAAKAIQLVGSATLVFASFGLLQEAFPVPLRVPLNILIVAWALEVGLVLGSRYWSSMLQSLAFNEAFALGHSAAAPEKRQRVLAIGGAGYIGSALVKRLLDAGYGVRVLDLLLFGEKPIADVLGNPDLEVVRADFRQVDQLVSAMRGVDAVVHLGGLVGDPACALDEDLTTEVNLDFSRLIAEVAKGAGVTRFVFASSCSVYGASDEVLNETSTLNPVSLYARSKIASENVLFEMASTDFVPTMLRFGTIYGLSGRARFDLVVNLLAAKAVKEGVITVFGGEQWRPFVHVDDAARAVVLALQAPLASVRNEIFNVGSDEQNATLGDIGRLVNQLVPEAKYIDSGPDGDRRNYRVDFAKTRNALGFTPEWTLEAGIRQVADAVRSGTVADYKDPMHSNVRFLLDGMAPRYQRVRKGWANERIGRDFARLAKDHADARTALPNESGNPGAEAAASARPTSATARVRTSKVGT